MELTVYLAAYGAILSTIVAIWNILRSLPKIQVKVVHAFVEKEYGIMVSIQNPSPHTAHITSLSFMVPSTSKPSLWGRVVHCLKYWRVPWDYGWGHSSLSNYELEDGCPTSIAPGKAHQVFVPEKALKSLFKSKSSKLLKVSVQDELWRNKTSKKFDYS